MRCFFALILIAASGSGQRYGRKTEVYGPVSAYQYGYATQDVEGTSSVEQSSDGSGRVIGKYTISLADGRQRIVTYWADESGFHADVLTNELGTESKSPADVVIQSSAPTGPEAAFESQRVNARSSYASPVRAVRAFRAVQGFAAAVRPVSSGRF